MSSSIKLIDVINLNADASCLSSERWLKSLEGGLESELYDILKIYVDNKIKVNLGIVGSTICEIIQFNPECIHLINEHQNIFQMLYRPFAHSLSLLWSDKTFSNNFELGKRLIDNVFLNVSNWYLPPEFALRNGQIKYLSEQNVGTFIHPKRLKQGVDKAKFVGFGRLESLQKAKLNCIGFTEHFDKYYLDILQIGSSDVKFENNVIFGWRDGESPLFLPNSAKREAVFVKNSSKKFDRIFLNDFVPDKDVTRDFKYYPQNSLTPWLGAFRLYWYLQEVRLLELQYEEMTSVNQVFFLYLLSSDILSSSEKANVNVIVQDLKGTKVQSLLIERVEKIFNAEEILLAIKSNRNALNSISKIRDKIFIERMLARLEVVKDINNK